METEQTRLARLVAAGDEEAFSQLVRAQSHTLYAAARAILRDDMDAQDCVQEAILKGWRKLPTLREPAFFATWLTRITVTTAINMSRRRKPSYPLPAELPAGEETREERLDVRRAIETLDAKTRVCAVLFYFEDLSVKDVARATGAREGTVKSRLHRARALLRDVLEGYDHENT